jgi:preprotein translocase subunit SecA
MKEFVENKVYELYELREQELGAPLLRHLERMLILQLVHAKWIDHLKVMDDLREGIGLRGYAQVDPFVEYSKEAHELFMDLLMAIREDVVKYVFRVQVELTPQAKEAEAAEGNVDETGSLKGSASGVRRPVRAGEKIGRNAPCPCGSGKKYKNCCMRK